MSRLPRWYDLITINIYYLGLSTLANTNGLVLPLLVQGFVGIEAQGAYLGRLRLWTLMAALLAQAVMGMLSDHSHLPWGRRRPFILTGTLLNLVFIALIGFSAGLSGMFGYTLLFVFVVGQQLSSNIAQGAQQGLIPDLVPEEQRGRFSAVKAVLELPLPLILVSFVVAGMVSGGNLWGALLFVMAVLAVTMLITLFVPEKRPESAPPPLDWGPILRLLAMTAAFTTIILILGAAVGWAGRALANGFSDNLQLLLMGAAGLAAMLAATGLGVWISVRLSLGRKAAAENPGFTWWVVNRLAFLVGAVNLSTFAVYYIQARLGYEQERAAGPASVLLLMVGLFIMSSALSSGWLSDGKYRKAFSVLAGASVLLGVVVALRFPSVILPYALGSVAALGLFGLVAALRLSERFGHKALIAAAGLTAAIGTLIALLSTTLFTIYLGGGIIGIAAGLFYTANWALGTELAPKEEAGRYLGISNLAGAGAGAVGAYIGGPIADYFTILAPGRPGIGYVVLFSIYGALFLISTLALFGIRARKPGPQAQAAAVPGD